MNNKIVSISNLNFSFKENNILNNISLDIYKGDFISIIGPNGSGKTTLLKNCLNLYNVKPNSIFIKDKDLTLYSRRELSKIIAYIPQNPELYYDLSVEDIVLMGRIPYLKFFEDYSKKDYEIANTSMIEMNIEHLKNKSIMTLSGGEKQKVFIAKALCQQAEIIFLDEPISELDIGNQIHTMNILKKLNENNNITIISVLHDLNIAFNLTQKIVVLKHGNIVSYSTPEEIIKSDIINSIFETNSINIFNKDSKFFISF